MILCFFHKNFQQIRTENCSEQGQPQEWLFLVGKLQAEGFGQGCGLSIIQRCMANSPLLLLGIPEGSGGFPLETSANSYQGCSGGKWATHSEKVAAFILFCHMPCRSWLPTLEQMQSYYFVSTSVSRTSFNCAISIGKKMSKKKKAIYNKQHTVSTSC